MDTNVSEHATNCTFKFHPSIMSNLCGYNRGKIVAFVFAVRCKPSAAVPIDINRIKAMLGWLGLSGFNFVPAAA